MAGRAFLAQRRAQVKTKETWEKLYAEKGSSCRVARPQGKHLNRVRSRSYCSSQSASADTHGRCCDLYEKHISPLSRGPFWDMPRLAQPKEEGCIPEELCTAVGGAGGTASQLPGPEVAGDWVSGLQS